MNTERKLQIFRKAIDWLTETSKCRADMYATLRHLGMTDDEIKEIPSMTEFIDDGSKASLYINAFVQCETNSLVLPLPTDNSNMLLKLNSIGVSFIPNVEKNSFVIERNTFIKVKLMAENSTGYHFIKLFASEDTLMDVSKTLHVLINTPDEIWPVLRERMVEGSYTTFKDLLDDIELLKRSYGEYVTSFYFPLYGELYDPDSCLSDSVSNRYLRDFKSEIEELLETEQESDNMTKYFGDSDSKTASEKIVSIKWDVTEIENILYGMVKIRHSEPLTDEEEDIIKDWIEGQNSDGFGEGIEQKGIDTEDGILYVQLWNTGDEYFIKNSDQMALYVGHRFLVDNH